jgi:hypothetical protein
MDEIKMWGTLPPFQKKDVRDVLTSTNLEGWNGSPFHPIIFFLSLEIGNILAVYQARDVLPEKLSWKFLGSTFRISLGDMCP